MKMCKRLLSLFLILLVMPLFANVSVNCKGQKVLSEYCIALNYHIKSGIGDRLCIIADLLERGIGFNKRNFLSTSSHKNINVEFLFKDLPDNNLGKTYLWYFHCKPPRYKLYGKYKTIYKNWSNVNNYADKVYSLLNIDKRKQEVLNKYKISTDYFDNTISLHIRCGDTKLIRVEPLEYYYEAVKYINEKTGANKVICFYENDEFSVKTAENIINKLKSMFPKIKFEKCLNVDTDSEELLLMSMCKHNIQSKSFFTKWATNFNTNPDKVIFLNPAKNYNGKGNGQIVSTVTNKSF